MLSTQISGKYAPLEEGIFNVKKHLETIRIKVCFPEGFTFVSMKEDVHYTFDIAKTTLFEKEKAFFNSVRMCDFHVLHNKFLDTEGYIGKSSSIETCYAMLFNRPIFSFSNCQCNSSVDIRINKLLLNNFSLFFDLEKLLKSNFIDIKSVIKAPINYNLKLSDQLYILQKVNELMKEYL